VKKSTIWAGVILLVLLVFCGLSVGFGLLAYNLMNGDASFSTGDAVAVIYVEGVIQAGDPPVDVFGAPAQGAYSNLVVRQLKSANSNDRVKAVVLRIDSPGGGVVASDEIYEQVAAMDKPVVVSMGTLAASGGYYISAPTDEIWANRHTFTGSIGVIMQFVNIEGFMEEYGLEANVIKSGANKDSGSMFRAMTAEEEAMWQEIINESYDVFVQIVADGRHIDEETVRQLADGRVYTGQQALELGLVDELGNLPAVIDRAAELGGIDGEPAIIDYKQDAPLLGGLFGQLAGPSPVEELRQMLHLQTSPSLMYLYTGN